MEQLTQTKPSETEVEVGTQFVFTHEPSEPNMVMQGINKAMEAVKLETRMFVFDAIHKTNYRALRHRLVEEQKRKDFETSIGIIRK